MSKSEILGYEPLLNEIKDLIYQKQYNTIKAINLETINLYWEIGEEINSKTERKWMGKVRC